MGGMEGEGAARDSGGVKENEKGIQNDEPEISGEEMMHQEL
jgi:hypothetical protein